ncbi:MAG: PhzF family phenazine biosynthesis protein [Candidatus Thermoplasmatota archaeon]|nr:PhzF family phenazine biosynthesis protein [Candidatus Thermoplasmatota archaeon]
MNVTVQKVNAFSTTPQGGNPAGVAINPPPLTPKQMQWISQTLKVSETAFIKSSTKADFHVRFFSPQIEVDLCGHATIATFHTLAQKKIITSSAQNPRVVHQETKAGILPVEIYFEHSLPQRVMMTQNPPQLQDISLTWETIAHVLHIAKTTIDTTLPLQKVSTGLFTLPVCLHTLKDLTNLTPDFHEIHHLCKKHGLGSWHVYTFETLEPTSTYHARNFAPYYGINEDPVTGTANGALSYYLKYHNKITTSALIAEQGDIIHRPGRVHIHIDKTTVKVGGSAYVQEEKTLKIP